jgi:Lon protease-like protein
MTTDPSGRNLPILPLRNTVLLPGSVMPSRVSRTKGIALIEDALAGGQLVGVVAQRESAVDDPGKAELYQVGTIAKLSRLPGAPAELIVLLQGISRFRIVDIGQTTPYLSAYVEDLPDVEGDKQESDRLFAQMQSLAKTVIQQLVAEPQAALEMIAAMDNLADLAALMGANLDVSDDRKAARARDHEHCQASPVGDGSAGANAQGMRHRTAEQPSVAVLCREAAVAGSVPGDGSGARLDLCGSDSVHGGSPRGADVPGRRRAGQLSTGAVAGSEHAAGRSHNGWSCPGRSDRTSSALCGTSHPGHAFWRRTLRIG